MATNNAGGFLHPSILSPPPSSTATSSISSNILPRPRNRPLKSASAKETAFINYVDHGVQQVTKQFAMKHGNEEDGSKENIGGYGGFNKAARDIERLIEVVWVSGTPSLQVPYLLSLALLVVSYIPSFPAAPKTMFRVLGKLDYAFASLIQGCDLDSGDLLPGCERGSVVSVTAKVRIKSLVERTRVVVVESMSSGEYAFEDSEIDTEGETDVDEDMDAVDFDAATDFDMDIARVYDRTLVELGDTLGGPAIGITGD